MAYSGEYGVYARTSAMTLCPIALAIGCRKCPAFSACPLKSVIGDHKAPDAAKDPRQADKPKG
jgi:hypothetical protein